MDFDVAHRDQLGFLTGSFNQGWLSYPVDVLTDIRPFLFPCQNCRAILLHVAAEQHSGLGFKLPFASRPIVSSGRKLFALCNACIHVSSELTDALIQKLGQRVIPTQFCNVYTQLASPEIPALYSEAFVNAWLERIPAERADLRRGINCALRHYALETDPESMRQSLCVGCQFRVVPIKTTATFWERLFSDKLPLSFSCPQCGKAVVEPAVH